MVKPFPTEILERIIYYYFRRDELLHTPEDNFTLITPSRGSTSLLLVSRAFRLLVLPSLFYSISITQPPHWELLFRWEQGLLDGFEDEARTRRSWVSEIRFDLNVHIPIALEPDGVSLSPDISQESRDLGLRPFDESSVSPALVSFPLPHDPEDSNLPPLPFFPNLNRVVLLPSRITSHLPWPTHLHRLLEKRHLELYRKEKNDSSAAFPGGQGGLAQLVLRRLESERDGELDDFFEVTEPRSAWIPVGGGGGATSIAELLWQRSTWSDFQVIKHLVVLPLPPPSGSSPPSGLSPQTLASLHTLAIALSAFEELELMANNVRFVAFPLDPSGRRRFWDTVFDEMSRRGSLEDILEDEEESEYETVMLKVVKEKNWAWVEEDGREVGFEDGLGQVEEL